LKKVAQDLETTLQHTTLALIRQRECDALEGLSIWARTMQDLLHNQARSILASSPDQEEVPAVATWMPGAILQSKGFYELAAEEYTQLLQQSPPSLAGGIEFVINQTTDCYARLADWSALSAWLPQIVNYTTKTDKPLSLAFDSNYLQALAKFDQGDYGAASGMYLQLVILPLGLPLD
jgi:lipopolysaccharide biosynthesis regulator YciM